MAYLGDFKQSVGVASLGVHCMFTSVKATGGAPFALVSGDARVIKNALASGLHATGVTLTQSAGSITGLNKVVVLTSAALYTTGNYDIILSTGSVNGINVRGYVVGNFSIKSRAGTTATGVWAVTARTLSSGGAVWTAAGKTLSSGLVIWSVAARTLTSGGVVWDASSTAHLTNATFGLNNQVQRANTAASGTASTLLLDAAAATASGTFNDSIVMLVSGTGAGQSRRIVSYSTGRRATVTPNWKTTPGSTSKFVIMLGGQPVLSSGSVVWSAATRTLTSGLVAANSVWAAGTKVLTSGLVVANSVWAASTRTLTSGLTVANSTWAAGTKVLTSGAAIASSVWAASTRTLSSGSAVWAATPRTLTSGLTVANSTWAAGTRTLTSGLTVANSTWAAGTKILTSGAAVASSVWASTTRVLTSGSIVWSAATRTLTSGLAAANSTWAASTRTMTSGGIVWSATLTELAAVPAAAPTPNAAIMFLYQGMRNKRITDATSDKVHTSATALVSTAVLSYVTGTQTFTKGKHA